MFGVFSCPCSFDLLTLGFFLYCSSKSASQSEHMEKLSSSLSCSSLSSSFSSPRSNIIGYSFGVFPSVTNEDHFRTILWEHYWLKSCLSQRIWTMNVHSLSQCHQWMTISSPSSMYTSTNSKTSLSQEIWAINVLILPQCHWWTAISKQSSK